MSENKINWISLTENEQTVLKVHPYFYLLQCSAWKVIMFRWTTDFRTDKQESKTHHTHSVIPYISQLWYKRERRLFNYSHWGGGNENTMKTYFKRYLLSGVLCTIITKTFWSWPPRRRFEVKAIMYSVYSGCLMHFVLLEMECFLFWFF